jgi:hypothetical protein
MLLIYLCVLALVIYLVIYVLGVIGVPLPPKVMQILWVIFGLIVLLLVVRMLLSGGGSLSLPGFH